jgi:AcrR family transcriptional regulator
MARAEKQDKHAKIVEAFMALLAEHAYEDVSLGMIAGRAGVSLADLREVTNGKARLLGDFARMIDRKVLDGIDAALADEPARERLFDVLMRRFDALGPYKAAIRSVDKAVRADPALGFSLLPVAVASQRWMLTAAEIDTGGVRGEIAARGLVMAFARAVRVWLTDEDPGLAATMAELDKRLREGEGTMRRLDDVARVVKPFARLAQRVMRARPRPFRRSRADREERESRDGGARA